MYRFETTRVYHLFSQAIPRHRWPLKTRTALYTHFALGAVTVGFVGASLLVLLSGLDSQGNYQGWLTSLFSWNLNWMAWYVGKLLLQYRGVTTRSVTVASQSIPFLTPSLLSAIFLAELQLFYCLSMETGLAPTEGIGFMLGALVPCINNYRGKNRLFEQI